MTVAVGFMAMVHLVHTITKASVQLSPLIESLTCCTFPRVLTHRSSTVKRNLALRAVCPCLFSLGGENWWSRKVSPPSCNFFFDNYWLRSASSSDCDLCPTDPTATKIWNPKSASCHLVLSFFCLGFLRSYLNFSNQGTLCMRGRVSCENPMNQPLSVLIGENLGLLLI